MYADEPAVEVVVTAVEAAAEPAARAVDRVPWRHLHSQSNHSQGSAAVAVDLASFDFAVAMAFGTQCFAGSLLDSPRLPAKMADRKLVGRDTNRYACRDS